MERYKSFTMYLLTEVRVLELLALEERPGEEARHRFSSRPPTKAAEGEGVREAGLALALIHENMVIIAFTNTHIGDRSRKHAHAMKDGMRHQTVQEVAENMQKQTRWTSYKYFCCDLP